MRYRTSKILIFLLIVFAAACKKETSYESGNNILGQSVGTLKDSLGSCQNIVIKGTYKADIQLTDSNYVIVQTNVTTPGRYIIHTDTANGFWFADSGYTTAGLQTIKLKGNGKPILALSTDFIVTYNNSFCIFSVTVGSNILTAIISDYFPTAIGSNWAYNVVGATDSLHVDATSKDSAIAPNTYRVFIAKQPGIPNDTSYYRKDNNGNYYQYGAFKAFAAGSNSISPFEYIFLKDNQPTGTQWESPTVTATYAGLSTQVKMHYIILAANTTVTFNGNLIDSVIKIQNDLQYKILGNFQTITTGYTYFAKNIGLINVDIPGFYGQTITRWRIY